MNRNQCLADMPKEHRVITWKTSKVANGFEYKVISVGYQVPTVVLESGMRNTRAQAVGAAKRACIDWKATQRATA